MLVQLISLFSLFVTPLILAFGDQVDKQAEEELSVFVWIVDIAWAIEICSNFITGDVKNRTFKHVATDYLRFWFWVDAISTFPSIIALQKNRWCTATKMLRLLHF